jgi:hypothetical protein
MPGDVLHVVLNPPNRKKEQAFEGVMMTGCPHLHGARKILYAADIKGKRKPHLRVTVTLCEECFDKVPVWMRPQIVPVPHPLDVGLFPDKR